MTDEEAVLIEALLEYIQRYGMTDKARYALNKTGPGKNKDSQD